MKDLLATLRPALMMLVAFSVLCGLAYPYAMTGIAQVAFPVQANGSILHAGGRPVGSALVGQTFDAPGYFWGRPSAVGYDATTSGGTNLGPTNPALADAVRARVAALRAADPGNRAPIPVDLVTSSASGLDPDLSPAAADYQVHRVAAARGLDERRVRKLVEDHVEERTLGILGERRVNVVELNRALDALTGGTLSHK